ncbi:MAG: polysaccharide biosynthesis/export family protein [Hyphomicrobium sp.]
MSKLRARAVENFHHWSSRHFTHGRLRILAVAAPALILSGTAIAQQTGSSETLSGALIGQQSLPSPSAFTAAAVIPPLADAPPSIATPAVLSAEPNRPDDPQTSDADNLSNAERITVKSSGVSDIAGEYRISSSYTISIPIIGRVNVRDMSVAALEQNLSDRASKISGRDAYVTVEIVEYRPIFITGLVARPGAAPWKPGMTIIQAIATSGGVFRAQADAAAGGGAGMGVEVEATRLRRATAEQKRALAALARLYAERDNADHIEVPERLIRLVGKPEAEQLIAAQVSLFQSRKTAYETLLASLEREDALAKNELEGLSKQVSRVADQLSLRTKILQDVETLQAKGLTRADRSLEERSRIAELQDRETSVTVSMARMNSMVAARSREIIKLKQDRRADIDTEIGRLERDVNLLDIDIEAAQSAYRRMTGRGLTTVADMGGPGGAQEVVYDVIRRENGEQKVIQSKQFSALLPGDIVVVK